MVPHTQPVGGLNWEDDERMSWVSLGYIGRLSLKKTETIKQEIPNLKQTQRHEDGAQWYSMHEVLGFVPSTTGKE